MCQFLQTEVCWSTCESPTYYLMEAFKSPPTLRHWCSVLKARYGRMVAYRQQLHNFMMLIPGLSSCWHLITTELRHCASYQLSSQTQSPLARLRSGLTDALHVTWGQGFAFNKRPLQTNDFQVGTWDEFVDVGRGSLDVGRVPHSALLQVTVGLRTSGPAKVEEARQTVWSFILDPKAGPCVRNVNDG